MPSRCSSTCGTKVPPEPAVPRQLCTRTVNPSRASAGASVSEPSRPYGERTTMVGSGGSTGPTGVYRSATSATPSSIGTRSLRRTRNAYGPAVALSMGLDAIGITCSRPGRSNRTMTPSRRDAAVAVPPGHGDTATAAAVCYGLVQVTVGVVGEPLPRKPNAVDPLAPTEPFQLTFRTVTDVPLTLSVPFHSWLIVCPLARVQRAVHPLTADVPARTVTSPWNPPGQDPTVVYVAEHPPTGGPLVGPAVVGPAVVGPAVVGPAVVGPAVVG